MAGGLSDEGRLVNAGYKNNFTSKNETPEIYFFYFAAKNNIMTGAEARKVRCSIPDVSEYL